MFEVDAETGAFCVLSDYVPVVNAAYKAVLVFQFYDPVDVLKIQFPAPADAEMAPAKTFNAADLEDLSEVVVVLHELDGTNQNGWNNELFEEFQFLNGIVHSEPAIAQAALHIMTYDDIVPPANRTFRHASLRVLGFRHCKGDRERRGFGCGEGEGRRGT